MSHAAFDAFRSELKSIRQAVAELSGKTLREDTLRERIRLLYISWDSTVAPILRLLVANKREFFKLHAELGRIAQLTSRFKPVSEYQQRLGRAITLADQLVLIIAATVHDQAYLQPHRGDELFLPEIPDVPRRYVPNSIVGWRDRIRLFLSTHPFDKSVFIMIRYRKRNRELISSIKKELSKHGLTGILASEHPITDDLYNPIACLLSCARGIAVFDKPESKQEFNPNVAYELGMLHLLGRKYLILKHDSLTALHTDILMKLYVPYTSTSNAGNEVRSWLESSDELS